MKRVSIYIFFGVVLLSFRLFINFNHELIPGINGGYYPLQIRSLIESGKLGFSDMPLYFYLNALIVKLVYFLTGAESEQVIILTLKIIDSLSLPLLVIPLYKLTTKLFPGNLSSATEIVLVAFATLSISPLVLVSDVQKNAFAIPLMAFFLYYLLDFLKSPSWKSAIAAGSFLLLTGVTHFGVFSVSISILLISLLVFYRKKALLFSLPIILAGFALIYVFDDQRADRVLWLFVILFRSPMLLNGPVDPPVLLGYIVTFLLIGSGIYVLVKSRNRLPKFQKNVLITLILTTFIFSFPLMGFMYIERFSLILFIPQFILALTLQDQITAHLRVVVNSMLSIIVAVAVFFCFINIKSPVLSSEAFADLKRIKEVIPDPDETLVIARHGLEWWTGWALHTKVGQDKSLNEEVFTKYKKVIILVHKKESYHRKMPQHTLIHEPMYPEDAIPVYQSAYFKAFEIKSVPFRHTDQ